MKSGIKCEQGEIVFVPFPFSDLSGTKKRPVLILSKTEYNQVTEDVITAGITSNIRKISGSLMIDNSNFEEGSIPVASMIRADRLFTMHQNLIIRKIGKLDKITFQKVKDKLNEVI